MAHCGDCEMGFSNNSSLRAHIKRKHPGKEDILCPKVRKSNSSSRVHVCKECSKTFVSFSNLRFHVKKKHFDKINELAPIEVRKHKCLSCDAEFHVLQHLIDHNKSHASASVYQCPMCHYLGASTDILITHYKVEHQLEINFEKLEFESFQNFQEWKSTIEKETFSSFIKVRGSTKNTNYTKIDYRCHRSGEYTSEGKNIRKLKTQGSNKIGGLCPAKIIAIIKSDGKCEVKFCKNHVGHQQQEDLGHLFLTKVERENMASKIALKIPLQSILDEIRDSVSNCHLERLHLLTKKDLFNIESSFKLSGSSVRHQNDALSVESWVNELKLSNSVLFYKAQDSLCNQFPDLKSEDFVLIIMTEGQKELLMNFGQDCICVDGTHGLNGYGFELHTLLVLDDLREGYPCAFLISNRSDTEVLRIFFSSLEVALQTKIKPRVFMSDMAESYYNAWLYVMFPAEFRLFCTWHVDRAWRKNLNKIKNDTEKKALIYRMLRMLLQERDIRSFENLINKFITFCMESPETVEFAKYFEDHYAKKAEQWAYCFRVNSGLNTNMHIERMHRTIKHLYLDGKFVKRLDKAISAIMKFVRDKLFERIIILHKGKISTKIKDLRHRHKSSESLDVTKVTATSEMFWIVASSSSKEMYVIEEVKPECTCKLICHECNSCIHHYSCTCIDSCIKWNMCKHVHLVCKYIQNLPKATQVVQEQSEINLVIDIRKKDEEVTALVKSISTDRPSPQCDLEQKVQLKQQEILQKFQENLFASKSLEELHVFENILAPLEPTLAAVRMKQKSIFVPLTPGTIPSNKSIEPQKRLFQTNAKKKKQQPLQKPSAEESDTLAIQLLYSDGGRL